ncbi:MAG: hypothetical protein K8F25_06820, partial [Fimbriimonadaceae bacterium]|nr:hypothetical protein [Alphaproteobacteria bacterium]
MNKNIKNSAEQSASSQKNALGDLPEWDLSDLYLSPDSKDLTNDLARVLSDSQTFEQEYKGKLAKLAARTDGGAELGRAIKQYESIEDLAGRIISYASLRYAGNSADPERAKFFGDVREKITTVSAHLLFFTLELNQIDPDVMAAALGDPALNYFKPWLEDIAREKPFQLDDRLEQLFLEKSVTGSAAWNRLFDETISALRFGCDGEMLSIEPTLNRLTDPDGEVRKSAAMSLSKVFGENLRLFALITNTLSKDKSISDSWRGFVDVADARHLANRVEAPVVDALENAVVSAYPKLSHRYYAMKAKWLGMDRLEYWDRNAPLPNEPVDRIPWSEAKNTVLSAYRGFSPKMADIANTFFDKNWIDAPVRDGKSPGA